MSLLLIHVEKRDVKKLNDTHTTIFPQFLCDKGIAVKWDFAHSKVDVDMKKTLSLPHNSNYLLNQNRS